jgi:hypothetical protein
MTLVMVLYRRTFMARIIRAGNSRTGILQHGILEQGIFGNIRARTKRAGKNKSMNY